MLIANINYPEPHFRIHRDPNCYAALRRFQPGTRLIDINSENRAAQVASFEGPALPFGASVGINQMWIDIDLGDEDLEVWVLDEIRTLLAARSTRFAQVDELQPCRSCG